MYGVVLAFSLFWLVAHCSAREPVLSLYRLGYTEITFEIAMYDDGLLVYRVVPEDAVRPYRFRYTADPKTVEKELVPATFAKLEPRYEVTRLVHSDTWFIWARGRKIEVYGDLTETSLRVLPRELSAMIVELLRLRKIPGRDWLPPNFRLFLTQKHGESPVRTVPAELASFISRLDPDEYGTCRIILPGFVLPQVRSLLLPSGTSGSVLLDGRHWSASVYFDHPQLPGWNGE
jgi:hypothetical protein